MHNRRQFLKSLGGAAAALWARCAAGSLTSDRRRASHPNFLFILTDDQRHDAMGCAGNRIIRTPNIDALAARGTRFRNAFVTLSICSPSRAACLTGQYGSSNGVTSIPGALAEPGSTIAWRLKEAGYRTGIVGKWHLNNSPRECGFDFSPHFVSNGPYYGRRVTEMGETKKVEGYIEDFSVDQSVRFITDCRGADKPFFLFHCTQVPHMNQEFDWPARSEALSLYERDDMPVPQTWQDDLRGKPPYLRTARSSTQALRYGYDERQSIQRHLQRYYAALTEMDATLGRILSALDAQGLRETTYVFLMGDNGWFLGEHGLTSKVLPYEESMRVPMIAAGPGIPAGIESRLVLNVDIPPTILELAGLSIPDSMHGASLVPLWQRGPADWRSSFLYEAPTPSLGSWPVLAIRTDRWKYIQTFELEKPGRLAFEELYDLYADPRETTNLAGRSDHARRQAALKGELGDLRRALGRPG